MTHLAVTESRYGVKKGIKKKRGTNCIWDKSHPKLQSMLAVNPVSTASMGSFDKPLILLLETTSPLKTLHSQRDPSIVQQPGPLSGFGH